MTEPTLAPAAALRRIAFLLERGREPTYKVRAFRRAAAAVDATDPADPGPAGRRPRARPAEPARDRGGHRAGHPRGPGRRGPGVPAAPGGDRGPPVAEGAAALRAALRGDCHAHSTWSDGGSPIGEMAEAARDLGHEYLVLTDHSPRLTVANGLSPERLLAQLDEVAGLNERAGPVPDPHRDRGRHPRGRRPRPDRRAAGPARRRRGQRPLQAAHARPGDDPADGRGRGQPPHRHPRPLHRPDRGRPGPARERVRPGGGVRRLRRQRRGRRGQLPARAPGPAQAPAAPGRRGRLPGSRSTPTPTPPASSTGSSAAASAPSPAASPPTWWSTPATPTPCSPGPAAPVASGWPRSSGQHLLGHRDRGGRPVRGQGGGRRGEPVAGVAAGLGMLDRAGGRRPGPALVHPGRGRAGGVGAGDDVHGGLLCEAAAGDDASQPPFADRVRTVSAG